MEKKLFRSTSEKMLCGVCGGLAEYFDIDPTLVRVGYVFLSLFSAAFPGLLLYIVMALIWLGAEGAVSAVSFMILFPVFCNAFANRLEGTDRFLKEAERLYPETFWYRLRYRILPELWPEILATGKTAAGLGLKVGIMAEILGQVRDGIGRSMNYARLNLDTPVIVAWTIVIIAISVIIDRIFSWLQAQQMKEEQ